MLILNYLYIRNTIYYFVVGRRLEICFPPPLSNPIILNVLLDTKVIVTHGNNNLTPDVGFGVYATVVVAEALFLYNLSYLCTFVYQIKVNCYQNTNFKSKND